VLAHPARQLPFAPNDPCQRQTGDVGTGEEQYESHRTHENEQSRSRIARELILPKGRADPHLLLSRIELRGRLPHGRPEGIHL
jgi:hypothetical protein